MHIPVLLNEVVQGLDLRPGMSVIDATIGGGGHAEAILKQIGPTGRLLGLDRDLTTLSRVKERLTVYPDIELVHGEFANLSNLARSVDLSVVDAILLDLGFSSLQLDAPERGLSFQSDGPLDMRLDRTARLTASEIVNRWSEPRLMDILERYGELYDARRLARTLIAARQQAPIKTTLRLIAVLGLKNPGVKAKVFQAFRIAVNDELGQLQSAIPQAVELLKPGGRLAIITFHSLEDRIVKVAFRQNHLLIPITKKPIEPSATEVQSNSRARSAKLRLAQKKD